MDRSLISRRGLLAGAAAASLVRPKLAQAQTTGVTPIFVKWDAWYDNEQIVTREFHEQLSPPHRQAQAPWFCKVLGPHRITCAGTQADVDIEIQAAAQAGIKAFMYVDYSPDADGTGGSTALYKGWQLHDSSTYKNMVHWCLDIGSGKFGYNPWSNTAGWQANCNLVVSKFLQPNYLKIGGRPIVFVAWSTSALTSHFAGSTANSITSFNYLRSQSISAGAGDPYIVSNGDISNGGVYPPATAINYISGNAVSAYVPWSALQYTSSPETFAKMVERSKIYWSSQQVATGKKVIPSMMMGWDNRARFELPGFSDGSHLVPWVGHENYYVRGTNTEIANHIQECIDFIGANPVACETKAMLVYAWNECTEGGTVGVPTLSDPPRGTPPTSNLLDAIRPVLKNAA